MRIETTKSIVGYAVLLGMVLCLLASGYYWDSDEARLVALALLVAIPIAGMVLLWRLGERLTVYQGIAIPDSATPVDGGIRWLEVRPEFTRQLRKDLVASAVGIWIVLLALALWVGYMGAFSQLVLTRKLLLAGLFAVIALLPATWVFWTPKVWRTRVGTDGSRFYLDPGDGKVEEYSFDALATENGLVLLAGRRLIGLRRYKQASRFDEEDLRGLILARIPRSARLGSYRLFLRTLRQGNRPIWSLLIMTVLWGVLAVMTVMTKLGALP